MTYTETLTLVDLIRDVETFSSAATRESMQTNIDKYDAERHQRYERYLEQAKCDLFEFVTGQKKNHFS